MRTSVLRAADREAFTGGRINAVGHVPGACGTEDRRDERAADARPSVGCYHPLRHASRDPSRCTAPRPPGHLFGRVRRRGPGPGGSGAAAGPPPRIRVSVDVVAVDVQVIDSTGRPVPNLGPEKFSVTINGRRRRVVSAEQIGSDAPGTAGEGAPAPATPPSTAPERVIMIAVDCISFDTGAAHEVIQNVQQFLRRLEPDDYVGLSVYPNGAVVTPTTNHAEVLRALGTVVGQRDGPGLNRFHLRPSEIIDANRDLYAGSGGTLDAVVARECGSEPDPNCRYQLVAESHELGALLRGSGDGEPRHAAHDRDADAGLPRAQDAPPGERRHDCQRQPRRPAGSRRPRHSGRQGSRGRQHRHLHALHRLDAPRSLRRRDEKRRPDVQQPAAGQGRPRAVAGAVHRRGRRRAVLRAARQRRRCAGADSHRALLVLPARRRAGRRGSRRPHARSRGEGDAAEPDDSRPALGDDSQARRRCRRRGGTVAAHRQPSRRHPRPRRRRAASSRRT